MENVTLNPYSRYVVEFTDVEKGLVPLASLVPLLMGFLVYKFFNRTWNDGDSGGKRMEMVNVITSAFLMGNLLFHSIPMATQFDYPLFSAAIMVGLIPYIYLQHMWKTFQLNPEHPVGARPLDNSLEAMASTNHGDDYEILEGDAEDMDKIAPIQYEARVARRFRRIVALSAFFSLLFQSSLDVLFMMYNPKENPHWQIILMFYVDKITESTVMCAILTYARIRRKAYIVLIVLYALIVGIGTIPAVRQLVDPGLIIYSVTHPFLSLVVGLSCGSLLWVTIVFFFIDIDENPKKCWGAAKATFFLAAMFVSWATAYWM